MIRRGWVTAFSQISMPPIRFQQERGPYLNYFTAQLIHEEESNGKVLYKA